MSESSLPQPLRQPAQMPDPVSLRLWRYGFRWRPTTIQQMSQQAGGRFGRSSAPTRVMISTRDHAGSSSSSAGRATAQPEYWQSLAYLAISEFVHNRPYHESR